MLRRITGLALGFLCLIVDNGTAAADPARKIYVGVFLHDVARLEVRDGLYEVDFDLWAKWRGEFDTDELQIANASTAQRTFLGEDSDRDWHTARWRVRGTLRGEFPMQRFPFDVQRIAVVLELPEHHGVLTPDAAGSGMAERFSITDWLYNPEFHPETSERVVSSDLGLLANEGSPSKVHRVAYSVRLERPIVTVALKLFLPLAIIVLVALVALFLPGETVAPRSSIGVTALLSCFAFQFTVADTLPAVSYITLADTLFLIAYLLSSLGLVTTIVSHSLFRRGRLNHSIWADRIGRVLLPLSATIAVWLAVPEREVPVEQPEMPLPQMERHESARSTLRIGVRRMSNILASPISRGVYWSLMKERKGTEPQAVFVARRPGVDNELVRFLATGEIEVTWPVREGVHWSDGRPLVAADLELPWDAYENEDVIEAHAIDDRTLVVRWSGRLASALDAPTVWPSHTLGDLFDEGGYDAAYQHRRMNPTPALGPYAVTEFREHDSLIATANEHFIGPAPCMERVEIKSYDSGEQVVQAYRDRLIDIAYPNAVSMEEALAYAQEDPAAVHIRPSSLFIYLQPDLAHPLLGRLAVRQGILHAIDRERIAREVYRDAGRVAHIPVPEHHPPGLVPTPHDPARATTLLDAAGATGATLKILHTGAPTDQQILGFIVEDLLQVGISVEAVEVPSTARVAREGEHGGLLLHVTRGERDAAPRRYWNLPLSQGNYDRSVRNDAYTDEVHALAERERRALYPERRDQIRDALFVLTAERLPNIPLVFAAQRILAHPDLQGWDLGADERFGEGLERWYFRRRDR